MSIQIKDTLTPHLAKMARGIKNKRPILQAMGTALVSVTQRSFRDASLRASPWPAKRDGSPRTLYYRGHLKQSVRMTSITGDTVMVGSDAKHAAIHQFGGTIRAKPGGMLRFVSGGQVFYRKKVTIPKAPFIPIRGNQLTDFAQRRVEAAAKAKVAALMRNP